MMRSTAGSTSRIDHKRLHRVSIATTLVLSTGWIVAGWGCRSVARTDPAAALLFRSSTLEQADDTAPEGMDSELARTDPLAFLRRCTEHYDRAIKDYRCTFLVRERVGDVLGPAQKMGILFRQEPFSVDVRWIEGAIGARRVNFVAGRWARDGKEFAVVYPTGLIALLTPAGVKRNIHAPDVLAAARRPIDQFGFRNTLKWFIHYSELAADDPRFELRYVGRERFDEHPCFVFERRLPYDESDNTFPDRRQRVYIDAASYIPRACFCYTDDVGQRLLGSYVARDIRFNVGLTNADFSPSVRTSGSVRNMAPLSEPRP